MGYQVEFYTYPNNSNKLDVFHELNNYVIKRTLDAGWGLGEGFGSTGIEQIRWYDDIKPCYEDALNFLNLRTSDRHGSAAVRYVGLNPWDTSEKLEELREKRRAVNEKLLLAHTKVYVKDLKSDYVTCKKCGSRMKINLLDSDICPICGNVMRSETTLKNIEKMHQRLLKLDKQIREEERKVAAKNGGVRWVVKIAYLV